MLKKLSTIILTLTALAMLLASPSPTSAQIEICPSPYCFIYYSTRICFQTLPPNNGFSVTNSTTLWTTGAATFCTYWTIGSEYFTAYRPTSNLATSPMGGCNFAGNITLTTVAYIQPRSFTCTINQDNGLPVELMDFSVD